MDWYSFLFFLEVLVGGLLSGVMYALVAIGFVLIYKTSGVLNFAQGAMVLFAALTFVESETVKTVTIGVILGWIMMAVLGPIYDIITKMKT